MARGLKPTNVEFDVDLVEQYIKKNKLKKVDVARFIGVAYSTLQNAFWNGRINPKTLRDLESLFGVSHGTFKVERNVDDREMPEHYRPEARTTAKKKATDRQKAYQAIWDDMKARGKL